MTKPDIVERLERLAKEPKQDDRDLLLEAAAEIRRLREVLDNDGKGEDQ